MLGQYVSYRVLAVVPPIRLCVQSLGLNGRESKDLTESARHRSPLRAVLGRASCIAARHFLEVEEDAPIGALGPSALSEILTAVPGSNCTKDYAKAPSIRYLRAENELGITS